MNICAKCRVELHCKKNSVGADFGNGHVYPGDLFECPTCNAEILLTNVNPSFDPDYTFQDQYLKMIEAGLCRGCRVTTDDFANPNATCRHAE